MTPNQALEQTRDSVLRYGEVVGCELLNFFVRQKTWHWAEKQACHQATVIESGFLKSSRHFAASNAVICQSRM
jgi:hypothetical protein